MKGIELLVEPFDVDAAVQGAVDQDAVVLDVVEQDVVGH